MYQTVRVLPAPEPAPATAAAGALPPPVVPEPPEAELEQAVAPRAIKGTRTLPAARAAEVRMRMVILTFELKSNGS